MVVQPSERLPPRPNPPTSSELEADLFHISGILTPRIGQSLWTSRAPATRTKSPSHPLNSHQPSISTCACRIVISCELPSRQKRSPCLAFLTLHHPSTNVRAPHLRHLELLHVLFPRKLFTLISVPTDNVNNKRPQGWQRLFRPHFCNYTRQMNQLSVTNQALYTKSKSKSTSTTSICIRYTSSVFHTKFELTH